MRRITCCILFALFMQGCGLRVASHCEVLERRVKELIFEIAIPNPKPERFEQWEGKQVKILKQLEDLGRPAVPFIIKYMDDRRLLPYQYMKLDNTHPDAFEAFRQYTPFRVVDALAGVLNQLTGMSFGFIYNRGRNRSEQERDKAVAGWREFLDENKNSFSCQA